jgi:hypothetical protein
MAVALAAWMADCAVNKPKNTLMITAPPPPITPGALKPARKPLNVPHTQTPLPPSRLLDPPRFAPAAGAARRNSPDWLAELDRLPAVPVNRAGATPRSQYSDYRMVQFDFTSEPGKGATFSIRLPIAL